MIGAIQDVTEEALERSARELLSYVVDSSDDAIIITNTRDGTITSWNRGAERLYGYTPEEAIGRPISLVEPPDRAGEQEDILRRVFEGQSVDRFETPRVRKDGSRLIVSLTVSPVRDANDRIVSAAVIARDVTERSRYEQRLRHLADHDQLTGLYNRRRFEEELKHELARAGRYHSHGAVLSIDIDNFKSINDSAGHAAGDAVLTEVASVLERRFRSSDVLARLGGDEFAVLLRAVEVDEARAAAENLLTAIHNSNAVFGGRAIQLLAHGAGGALAPLSVNLSGESVVGDPKLLELIEFELHAAAVDPAKLIFEVTETAAIANMPEASAFAEGVKQLGASLALDDFGTGFGSFYYLKHLPVSYIKLDGEFVQNLPRSEIDAHMVTAIVGVAQGLGIKTIAEWVTDDETIRLLRRHGVDFAQGFHVGRPGPIVNSCRN